MRMHRGSSKGGGSAGPAPETLPLSAPPPVVRVELHVTRAARVEVRSVEVPRGAPLRAALRAAGLAPEGCAVLCDAIPWPLDQPLERPGTLTVVPTFSGG